MVGLGKTRLYKCATPTVLVQGPNLITKFLSSIIALRQNKPLWLDGASHVMSFNQSECIISELRSSSTLKLLYEISSSHFHVLYKCINGNICIVKNNRHSCNFVSTNYIFTCLKLLKQNLAFVERHCH